MAGEFIYKWQSYIERGTCYGVFGPERVPSGTTSLLFKGGPDAGKKSSKQSIFLLVHDRIPKRVTMSPVRFNLGSDF